MNLLILGSQGFIGSKVIESFREGHTVIGCDLIEYSPSDYRYYKLSILSTDFEDIFLENKFDACINCSGSGNVAFSMKQPLSDFEANTLAVAHVLEIIRKHQPTCKYIHLSSAAVYGNPLKLPISETDALAPVSAYGYHKMMSEMLCKEYHLLYGLPIAILRPFSVYGRGLRKQLLWDICQKLRVSDQISLFGTGAETRDFIHISDLVSLITLILNRASFTCDVFNAATGTETTIAEVARIFETNYPGNKRIGFSGEKKAGDPVNWRSDISKALTLGFIPTVSLDDGIQDYVKFFIKHLD